MQEEIGRVPRTLFLRQGLRLFQKGQADLLIKLLNHRHSGFARGSPRVEGKKMRGRIRRAESRRRQLPRTLPRVSSIPPYKTIFLKNTQITLEDHQADIKGVHYGAEVAGGGIAVPINVFDWYAVNANPPLGGTQQDLGLSLEMRSRQFDGADGFNRVKAESALGVFEILA